MFVHPLRVDRKEPLWRDWESRATRDPELITRIWRRAPYNIGVACGPSELVVVDQDVPHDDEEVPAELAAIGVVDGASAWRHLIAQTPGASEVTTMTVRTRSGGLHKVMAAAAGVTIRNSARTLGPWLDVRAAGGYVVGIGSMVDGGRYVLEGSATTPALLPGWLLTLLTASPEPPKAGGGASGARAVARLRAGGRSGTREQRWARGILNSELAELAAMAAGTGRNNRLNKAAYRAGQLVGAGLLEYGEAEHDLIETARACGVGTSNQRRYVREIEATVASGMQAGLARPRYMDPRARQQVGGAA